MAGKQVTFKPTDETVEKFEKLFKEAQVENPLLSKPKFFEMLLSKYEEKPAENSSENQEYFDPSLTILKSIGEALNLSPENYNEFDILAEIRATQQRAMMALQTQEIPEDYQRPLAENEILFTIPELHLSLLKTTTQRLSSPENTVTIKDILLDMFLRYEVQRQNEWFYPWVIKDEEFEQITGYSRKQLKKLCQE